MISGVVQDRQPIIRLTFFGPVSREEVDAVVDTGFSGYVAAPTELIRDLNLEYWGKQKVRLGNGSRFYADIYLGEIDWYGDRVTVDVMCLDGEPLIGMSQMEGSSLYVQVTDGGPVEIEPS